MQTRLPLGSASCPPSPHACPLTWGGPVHPWGSGHFVSHPPIWCCLRRGRGLPSWGFGHPGHLGSLRLAHFSLGDQELQPLEVGAAQMLCARGCWPVGGAGVWGPLKPPLTGLVPGHLHGQQFCSSSLGGSGLWQCRAGQLLLQRRASEGLYLRRRHWRPAPATRGGTHVCHSGGREQRFPVQPGTGLAEGDSGFPRGVLEGTGSEAETCRCFRGPW